MSLYQKTRSIWASATKNKSDFAKSFIKKASGSFGVKICGVGLAFVTSLILARLLQTKGFGIYTYALTWASLLSIPATLGLDNLLIREVSVYNVRSNWGLIKGILSWANLIVFVSSGILATIAAAVAWLIYHSANSLTAWAIWIGLIGLPINSLRNIRLGAMRGFNKVVLASIPELLISPLLIIGSLGFWSLLHGENNGVLWILGIRMLAVVLSFFLGIRWLYQIIPPAVKQATAEYRVKNWLQNSWPFMFLGVTEIVNSQGDILMLGAIKGVEVVGIYGVVSKISVLVIFIQGAANNALGPIIAGLYAENKMTKLRQVLIKSARIVFLVSLLTSGFLFLSGRGILSFFGSDFIAGYGALTILTVGQLLNSMFGPVGLLLNMTGYQKMSAISVSSCAILNLILNYILIPKFGINGAAIATSSSIVAVNLFNVLIVNKKLKIAFTPIAIINPKISK